MTELSPTAQAGCTAEAAPEVGVPDTPLGCANALSSTRVG